VLTPLCPNLAESAWQPHGLWHAVAVKQRRFAGLVLSALTQQRQQFGRKVELGYYF
jgi:hypothetical protein